MGTAIAPGSDAMATSQKVEATEMAERRAHGGSRVEISLDPVGEVEGVEAAMQQGSMEEGGPIAG